MHVINERDYLDVKAGSYSVRLAYTVLQDDIYLVSTDFSARWPSALMRSGQCNVRIGQEMERVCYPSLVVDDALKKEILNSLMNKYGMEKYGRWFSSPSRFIRLGMKARNGASGDKEKYFSWLEDEFDSIADQYDTHIFGNRINVYLRDRSLKLLNSTFPKKSHILEIGSGSGAETVEMLKGGHEVVAVDISQKMLDTLSKKAGAVGLSERLTTIKLRASELQTLTVQYRGSFDGIYSTYGAINCEPDISMLPEQMYNLTTNEGKVVMGIYNKLCVSDPMLHAVGLKLNRVFERMRAPVPEGRSRFCIDVYPYSSQYISRLFGDYFRTVRVEGVPVILPPSNYSSKMFPPGKNHSFLISVDSLLSTYFPFKFIGDHFLISMKRKK